jgi:hypothetical protein
MTTPRKNWNVLEKPGFQIVLFLLVASIFCFLIYKGVIGDSSVLEGLSETKTARGLITFIFAVGTIAIAILVCLGALIGRGDPAKESFYRAKEILTILVGILGTIVGFYFGTANEVNPVKLTVAKPFLSAQEVQSEGNILFTTFVSGGKTPYRYTITFPQLNDSAVEGLSDKTGWIRQQIKAPPVSDATRLVYQIDVEDAGGAKESFKCKDSEGLLVMPMVKPPPKQKGT